MKNLQSWNMIVITLYIGMTFFAAPHLVDDFLYGIPEEFGLTVIQCQWLVGTFFIRYMGIFALVVQQKRGGYYGAAFMGSFLALAVLLKHMPKIILPEPYWSGFFSEFTIIGLMICGILVTIAATFALKEKAPAN